MTTQVDYKETEFPFDSLQVPAMIVVMGLPFTRTEEVAGSIGRWARCPILIMDDFLDSILEEAGYDEDSLPSTDEAERLKRLALDTACRVARRHLKYPFSGFKCVVIKSLRICSPYELQRLVHYSLFQWPVFSYSLIFVECQFKNEYRWKLQFLGEESRRKWYEACDWKEIEQAKEDYNAQALDLHLLQLFCNLDLCRVRRLVVDPYYDLNMREYWESWEGRTTQALDLSNSLASAIMFLLTADVQELDKEIPQTVELRQLRWYLMEKKIAAASASIQRSEYFCGGGACVFKYSDQVTLECTRCCGVCEEPLVEGEPGYTCYFCALALHKSCAEMPHFTPPSSSLDALFSTFLKHIIIRSSENHVCKSCKKAGQVFSYSCACCLFQTHLKSRLIPTVIRNPDFHEHMVSLRFHDNFTCKGCGWVTINFLQSTYGCSICETYYDAYCAFWPKEFKHTHGGHEHLMKLMLSHDGAKEEDYWCDDCYGDIDPQVWFYSCQHCPYYVAHLTCTLLNR